jgi:hypothetical protein
MNRTILFVAVAAAVATAGCTSVPPTAAGPNPADPAAVAPPVEYRPVFSGYQAYTDQPVGNWREANDAVGRIGGWREYAREAEAATPSGTPPPAGAAPKPAAGGHAGHTKP